MQPEQESTQAEAVPAEQFPLPPQAPLFRLLGLVWKQRGDTVRIVDHLYRELGPVFRVPVPGARRYTFIAGKSARRLLSEGIERHLDRHALFDDVAAPLGNVNFVLAQSGAEHKRLRRLLSIAYSRQMVSPFVPELLEVARTEACRLPLGKTVPVQATLERMAFELYCHVLTRRSFSDRLPAVSSAAERATVVVSGLLPKLALRDPWFKRRFAVLLGIGHESLAAHRAGTLEPGPAPDLMQTLMDLVDEDGRPFNDDEIVSYAVYGFVGACVYIARLATWIVYELLTRPEVLAEVVKEVDAGFAAGIRDASDIRALRTLHAVYQECLRYRPVSLGLPYIAKEDFECEGHRIAAGSYVMLSHIPLHFSEPPFRESQSFDHARCRAPRNEHRREQSYYPFGLGHRACTAGGLVEVLTLSIIATLLHSVRLERSPSTRPLWVWTWPLPAPSRGFSMRPIARRSDADRAVAERTGWDEWDYAAFELPEQTSIGDIIASGVAEDYAPGQVVFEAGDTADAVYLVLSGTVEVLQSDGAGNPRLIRTLGEGQVFGEIGVLTNSPRSAAVRASTEGARAARLSATAVQEAIASADMVASELLRVVHRRQLSDRLRQLLPGADEKLLNRALGAVRIETVPADTAVVREGDPSERFYLILEGELLVQQWAHGVQHPLKTLGAGDFFGELGLLNAAPRSATVSTTTTARLASIDREGFRRLLARGEPGRVDLLRSLSLAFGETEHDA